MPYASRSVGDASVVRSSSTVSWERTSVSRWRQRRASALSECFAEAVGLFIADTRKRAQRLMSTQLVSPSRDSRSSAGAFTISVLRGCADSSLPGGTVAARVDESAAMTRAFPSGKRVEFTRGGGRF